jgi:hypothetical protein
MFVPQIAINNPKFSGCYFKKEVAEYTTRQKNEAGNKDILELSIMKPNESHRPETVQVYLNNNPQGDHLSGFRDTIQHIPKGVYNKELPINRQIGLIESDKNLLDYFARHYLIAANANEQKQKENEVLASDPIDYTRDIIQRVFSRDRANNSSQ